MKRPPRDWEKIFANDVTDKGLVSKIYKQLLTLIASKQTTHSKKWAEDLNRRFSKEYVQMANRHMKRYSTPLVIREMQIKPTMRYHLTPTEWLSSKNQQTTNAGEGVERNGTLLHRKKSMTNLDSILKGRDITLPTKVCIVKAIVFPVVMYGCESWTIKKAER